MFCYKGIYLRVVEESDIEHIRQLRNDHRTWIYLTDCTLLDALKQQRWYESLADREDRKYFILFDKKHDFLGIVRLDEVDKTNRSIRIGCDIVPRLRGKGYGNKAMYLIKKYCFDYLNMHRLWLAVLETNKVAFYLYKKHGFKEEGRYRKAIFRDGRYLDYIIMSLLEEECRK
jgi:UDP-4-amino-4,6-dideoxy-N-acetyl-beta-L-altrosamine N-acetyltransferase